MRKAIRTSQGAAPAAESDHAPGRWRLLPALGWNYRDVIALGVAVVGGGAILINVLFMQSGQHPAPMFKSATASVPAVPKEMPVAVIPRARPVDLIAIKVEQPAPARTGADIVSDIQRELARRGHYDGVVDGRYGPRTISAIREFEQMAGLKPSTEASEVLLQAIKRSPGKSARAATSATTATTGATTGRAAPQPVRNDAIAAVLAPSKRVLAVQRALAEYGYGQIKPTGVIDAETQAAIEKFERERKLPVTGQPSERVARELAVIIGRPLD